MLLTVWAFWFDCIWRGWGEWKNDRYNNLLNDNWSSMEFRNSLRQIRSDLWVYEYIIFRKYFKWKYNWIVLSSRQGSRLCDLICRSYWQLFIEPSGPVWRVVGMRCIRGIRFNSQFLQLHMIVLRRKKNNFAFQCRTF